jgi:hypothetical protein
MKQLLVFCILVVLVFWVAAQEEPTPYPIGETVSRGSVVINSVRLSALSEEKLGVVFTMLNHEDNVIHDVPIMNISMSFDSGASLQGRVANLNEMSQQQITFLVNTSSSMLANSNEIISAIDNASKIAANPENLSIMGFDETTHTESIGDSQEQINRIIEKARERNSSQACIYDALADTILNSRSDTSNNRRSVILITDNSEQGDACKRLTPDGFSNSKANTSVYVLFIGDFVNPTNSLIGNLYNLSESTGGILYRVDTMSELDIELSEVMRTLGNQQIAYADICLSSDVHQVTLSIDLADRNGKISLLEDTFFFQTDGCQITDTSTESVLVGIENFNVTFHPDTQRFTIRGRVRGAEQVGEYQFLLRNTETSADWPVSTFEGSFSDRIVLGTSGLPKGTYQILIGLYTSEHELLGHYYDEGHSYEIIAMPTSTATPLPTNTATESSTKLVSQIDAPSDTPTATPLPTNTATESSTKLVSQIDAPSDTPTATPLPTDTPTATSLPTDTSTATSLPTDTSTATSLPTDMPTATPPDSDGDGIVDEQDKCPEESDAGRGLTDEGCPVLAWWQNPLIGFGLFGIVMIAILGFIFRPKPRQDDSEPIYPSTTPPGSHPLPIVSKFPESHTIQANQASNEKGRGSSTTPLHTRYETLYEEAQITILQCKNYDKGETFYIYRSKPFLIGRDDPSSKTVPPDIDCKLESVSRRHCEIYYDNDLSSYVVEHLGDNTLTFVDNKPIGKGEKAKLKSGSIIRNLLSQKIETAVIKEWLELRFDKLDDKSDGDDPGGKGNVSDAGTTQSTPPYMDDTKTKESNSPGLDTISDEKPVDDNPTIDEIAQVANKKSSSHQPVDEKSTKRKSQISDETKFSQTQPDDNPTSDNRKLDDN